MSGVRTLSLRLSRMVTRTVPPSLRNARSWSSAQTFGRQSLRLRDRLQLFAATLDQPVVGTSLWSSAEHLAVWAGKWPGAWPVQKSRHGPRIAATDTVQVNH